MKKQIFLYLSIICNIIISVISTNLKVKFISFISIIFLLFYFLEKKVENYDYEEENPNALVKGKNIAGTVYADDPENVPGLGWIL